MGLIERIFLEKEKILYKEVLFSDIFKDNVLYVVTCIDKYVNSVRPKKKVEIYADAGINNDGSFISMYVSTKVTDKKEVIKISNFSSNNINVLESVALFYAFVYAMDNNYKAVIYNDNKEAIKIFNQKFLIPLENFIKKINNNENLIKFKYIPGDRNKADNLIRYIRMSVFGKSYRQVRRRNKKKKVSKPDTREM